MKTLRHRRGPVLVTGTIGFIAAGAMALAGLTIAGCGKSDVPSDVAGGAGGAKGSGGKNASATGGAGGSEVPDPGASGGEDAGPVASGGAAGEGGSGGAAGGSDCFVNPTTHFEIINACTNAEKVDKETHLPLLLSDGGLPALP